MPPTGPLAQRAEMLSGELHRLARWLMAGERAGHRLPPALTLNADTVRRDWTMAGAWRLCELRQPASERETR